MMEVVRTRVSRRRSPPERSVLRLCVERLEDRLLLSVSPMTEAEQHLHEVINWWRAHPSDAARNFGVDLNADLAPGTITADPKPPLARNDMLREASEGHLADMLKNNFFSHTGSNGSTYIQRIEAAGYTNWQRVGENLVWYGPASPSPLPDYPAVVAEQIKAWYLSASHRKNLMNPAFVEAGTGYQAGPFAYNSVLYNAGFAAQDFGTHRGEAFLTGLGCTKRLTDIPVCDVRSPIRMATLTATRQSDQLQMQTQTGRTGEYDLKLPDGTWDLRVAVPGLRGELAFPGVVMAGQNVKLDFTATNLTPWRNLANPLDVDNDGHIWPLDAMKIINKLNEPGAGPLSESPWPPVVPPPYVDVSGDNYLAPIDALLVINELNREASGEGESRFGGSGGVLSAEAVWFPSDGSCSDAFRELASGPDSLGGFGGMYPAGFPHSDTCEEVAESLVEVNRSARSGEITRQATDAFCALLGGNETDEWDELLPLADEWSTR